MRILSIFLILVTLVGCSKPLPQANPVTIAQEYLGLNEYNNRSQIKRLTGVDPIRTEWCAAFVNAILEIEGIPGSETVSENPLMARSFLTWGTPVKKEDIQKGDIVVFPRGSEGWKGHVGFYVKTTDDGKWLILGGNQDNTVSYAIYNPKRAIGIRRHLK